MSENYMKFLRGPEVRARHDLLTDEFAAKMAFAFSEWLANELHTTTDKLTVAVGRDSRPSGVRLQEAVIRGLSSADCDIVKCDLSTSPEVFRLCLGEAPMCDGAVMISAGHLSAQQNGVKLFTRMGGVNTAAMNDIITRAQNVKLPQRLVKAYDPTQGYIDHIKDAFAKWLDDDVPCPLVGLHVVVDAQNGSGGFFAELLESLGAYIDGSINLTPTGEFPMGAPNPESLPVIERMKKLVLENEADMGVIFDSECDRALIIDQDGKLIHRNRLIALMSAVLLDNHPNQTIITDSVTSPGLTRFINEWGGVHYRFKRGYRNVIDEAIRLNDEGIDCPLAIETSGHAAFRDNGFLDDGVYLASRIAAEVLIRKRNGETISHLIDELHEPVESVEIRMDLPEEDSYAASREVIEVILSHTLDNPLWRLSADNREGVRIMFDLADGIDNAWFMLRLSAHDPVMPLNVESDVKGGAEKILKELYTLLKEADITLDISPIEKAIQAGC